MQRSKYTDKSLNSKGAPIFKKMLEDKKTIGIHLKNGGKFSELKEIYKFVKPLPMQIEPTE